MRHISYSLNLKTPPLPPHVSCTTSKINNTSKGPPAFQADYRRCLPPEHYKQKCRLRLHRDHPLFVLPQSHQTPLTSTGLWSFRRCKHDSRLLKTLYLPAALSIRSHGIPGGECFAPSLPPHPLLLLTKKFLEGPSLAGCKRSVPPDPMCLHAHSVCPPFLPSLPVPLLSPTPSPFGAHPKFPFAFDPALNPPLLACRLQRMLATRSHKSSCTKHSPGSPLCAPAPSQPVPHSASPIPKFPFAFEPVLDNVLLGYSQVVKHSTLILKIAVSNPTPLTCMQVTRDACHQISQLLMQKAFATLFFMGPSYLLPRTQLQPPFDFEIIVKPPYLHAGHRGCLPPDPTQRLPPCPFCAPAPSQPLPRSTPKVPFAF